MTYTCKICGKEVSKRGSIHVGNGERACREHSAVFDMALDEKKKEMPAAAAPKSPYHNRERKALDFSPRCFICNERGLPQDQWYIRLLTEWEKYETIHGHPPNLFNPQETAEVAGILKGIPCLFYVKWEGRNTKIRIPSAAYQAARVMGFILACQKCVAEKGLITESDEASKGLSLDDIAAHSVTYELVLKPLLRKIAEKELQRDN